MEKMSFQYIPYLWLLLISFTILIFLAIFAFRYRKVRGAKAFGLCMLIFAFWTVCHGLEMAGTDLSTKLFWANMQYLSYTTIHICWFYMVLQFTGYKKWISPGRILLLLLIPFIFNILVWTDQYHGLVRYGFQLDYGGSFPVIEKSYGPLYWIHPIYGYTIELISIFLIMKAVLIHKSIYRMQALALLISPIISIVPSILYVFSLSPIKRFDITPAFLGVSGIVALVGLFRYQLFAVVPVARDIAVDNIDTGMIIVDVSGNIVDTNVFVEKILGVNTKDLIGQSFERVAPILNLPQSLQGKIKKDIEIDIAGEDHIYEVQLLPIINKNDMFAGNTILIRDVTDIRNNRMKIIEQNRQIAASSEREKVSRDLHDNLGQVMGFINLQAQGIRNELESSGVEVASDQIEKLIEITRNTHKQIRDFIENNSMSRKEIYFIYEFEDYIKKYEKESGLIVQVEFNISKERLEQKINKNRASNLINIIKEALNNIRKHAEASIVEIIFNSSGKQIICYVRDNGVGFEINTYDNSSNEKFGLNIMRARAEEMGGQVEVVSSLGEGTTVKVKFPYSKK